MLAPIQVFRESLSKYDFVQMSYDMCLWQQKGFCHF